MAIGTRIRYEVLRRDNFACRYCGAKAPYVELHVDHVISVSLGGTDDPWNLTAACVDCNLGKSNGVPDDKIIWDVRQDETTHMRSTGYDVEACEYCARPVLIDPEDGPADFFECQPCNEIVVTAHEAGVKWGRRIAGGLV